MHVPLLKVSFITLFHLPIMSDNSSNELDSCQHFGWTLELKNSRRHEVSTERLLSAFTLRLVCNIHNYLVPTRDGWYTETWGWLTTTLRAYWNYLKSVKNLISSQRNFLVKESEVAHVTFHNIWLLQEGELLTPTNGNHLSNTLYVPLSEETE